jgi:hypothetical protein
MRVDIKIKESDLNWLKRRYGKEWVHRLEQHIENEIKARKDRSGWYDAVARSTGKSSYKFE